jgi:DNA-binding transcriptional regulator LsrR (DeoR family)
MSLRWREECRFERRRRGSRAAMSDAPNFRLGRAARAGWLYYVAGKTQDDIARILRVSRPTAQRLVSMCRSERLVTIRMNYPVDECMNLAASLAERYGLVHCDVVPTDGTADTARIGVAEAAAACIEYTLRSQRETIMALGTGRSMRASVERIAPMSRPMHRLVSLVGNISPDGSASPFDALVRLAEVTGAKHFPMPLPLHAETVAERRVLLAMPSVCRLFALAARASTWMLGIGGIDRDAVLFRDGFINRGELMDAIRAGGVGEIAGHIFDAEGRILDCDLNARVMTVPPEVGTSRPRICVAHGRDKVVPVRAALTGRLVNGLVTDEITARELLAPEAPSRVRRGQPGVTGKGKRRG